MRLHSILSSVTAYQRPHVCFPVAIWIAGSAARQSPGNALRALGQGRTVLYLSIFTGIITMAGALGGAALGDVRGAAWGYATSQILIVEAWWVALAITTSGEIHKSRSSLRASALRRPSRTLGQ